MARCEVVSKDIRIGDLPTKIGAEVTPRSMNMVAVVLSTVVLHKEGLALNPVVMSLTWLHTAHPCKHDGLPAILIDRCKARTADFVRLCSGMDAYQLLQCLLLLTGQCISWDSRFALTLRFPFLSPPNVSASLISDNRL